MGGEIVLAGEPADVADLAEERGGSSALAWSHGPCGTPPQCGGNATTSTTDSDQERHMSDPVRLALIGCGRIAQVAHLPAVEKAEGVELVAVSDPSGAVAHSVARRYGLAAAYTNQGSVWADESVEAVI